MHLVVGWLALKIATGGQSQRADHKGALGALIRQPLGRFLVLGLAVGFLGYASWRLIEAVLNPEDKSTVKRIGYALRGVLYLGFFGTAVAMALRGAPKEGQGGSEQQDATAKLLEWSFGRPLVIAIGFVVIAIGAWNGWRAISHKFEKDLKKFEMSKGERELATKLGFVGHLARMAAYLLVGGFLVRAAIRFKPDEGVGLDAALHQLAGKAYGPWLLGLVALGLAAFGLFQFFLARYRPVLEG